MLIFWKQVFVEDSPLFNKDFAFHEAPEYNKTYIPSQTDKMINLITGVSLLACFIVSCTLNYLVFRFNKLKQSNITNFLFKSLSLVDLLTTLYAPWLYASLMFSPELYPCKNKLATFTRQLVCILGCTSQVITWMLAVTRFFRVILPFTMVRKKTVFLYISVYSILMTINSTISLSVQITDSGTRIMSVLVHFCFLVNLAHCSTGIVFSVVTSMYLLWCTYLQSLNLRRTFQDSCSSSMSMIRQRLRSCVTILLMNIPYLTTIGFIVYVNVRPGQISFHDVLFGLLPIFTSTLNPIIVTIRNFQKIKMILVRDKRLASRPRLRSCGDGVAMTDTSKMTSPRPFKGTTSPSNIYDSPRTDTNAIGHHESPRTVKVPRKGRTCSSPVFVRVSIRKRGSEQLDYRLEMKPSPTSSRYARANSVTKLKSSFSSGQDSPMIQSMMRFFS